MSTSCAGSVRRSVLGGRGRQLLLGAVLSGCGAMVAAACSEPPGVNISDNPGVGGDQSVGGEVDPVERCGEGAIECGAGCCREGENCVEDRCIPANQCSIAENDCGSDSQCGGGRCVSWRLFPEDRGRFNRGCRVPIDLPSVIPTVQCQWPGDTPPAVEPESINVISTPMVADFDFDGGPEVHPSIVFISYASNLAEGGILRVIDGETCELQHSGGHTNRLSADVSPALGDINADGRPDIIVADREVINPQQGIFRSGLLAFEAVPGGGASGTFRQLGGRRSESSTEPIKGLSIHNLDEDEFPEIFTQNTMFTYDPMFDGITPLLSFTRPSIERGEEATPLASQEPPAVIDVDGDQRPEIVTSQGIYVRDTTTIPEQLAFKTRGQGNEPLWDVDADVPSSFVALANLGEFPTAIGQGADSVEMVVVGFGGELWVMKVDGGIVHHVDAKQFAGGPPVIADFDGDGRMEFASPGRSQFTVFDLDCVRGAAFADEAYCGNGAGELNTDGVLWQSPTRGQQSGAAVFDFDGDRRAEVVYADQCFMRVYDGRSGDVLFSVPRSSTTRWEYPVVVDSDGDGHSELITTSNSNDQTLACPPNDPLNPEVAFEATAGVTVWRDGDDRWQGSRAIWNQHNYYVTNVNDDGTIPSMRNSSAHWDPDFDGPNSFRQNVQGETGISLELPDITTAGVAEFECRLNQTVADVTVDLCNRGLLTLEPGEARVTLLQADSLTNELCSEVNARPLAAGECVAVTCPVDAPIPGFDIMIMGDAGAAVDECSENNNGSSIARVSCVGGVQ